MTPREKWQQREDSLLSPYGQRSSQTRGRLSPEEESEVRTCYQRDVDRITHSKAFRRLKHKTQVFLQPVGDHYRTRLTHTLEVTRIARTMARALDLNEDLAEAIGLGHDLGHTPFGHAGERALNILLKDVGGFRHYEQSLRVVDVLEKEGEGLNLTHEVRNGILRNTNDPLAETLEGQLVRLGDRIAYINHDVDDAIRAGILSGDDIPERVRETLGNGYSARINSLIVDAISASEGKNRICMSPGTAEAMEEFHRFMYANVYLNPKCKSEESKVFGILSGIYEYYVARPDKLPPEFRRIADEEGMMRAVGDYVSGMTDTYAVSRFSEIYIPSSWAVR